MSKSESEPFTSIEEKKPKNRGSQLLLVLALLVCVVGGLLAMAFGWVGLVVLALGFVSLIALAAWSIKNWDY
jgi:hypothetical protein